MTRVRSLLLLSFLVFFLHVTLFWGVEKPYSRREYIAIKQRLGTGWNTWDSHNVLAEVLLPDAFSINVAFKQFNWMGYSYLSTALPARTGEGVEQVRPGLHALDGGYSELELHWNNLHVKIESAVENRDLVMLITPLEKPASPARVVVEIGMLWNRPGSLSRDGDALDAKLPSREIRVHATGSLITDPYIPSHSPFLVLAFDGPVGVSVGRGRTLEEIRRMVQRERSRLEESSGSFGRLRDTYLAIESALAWNTVYEPSFDRVVSTVGRLWNEQYGGYGLFGWDNFFLAYVSSLYSQDLAYANFIEHLRSMTEEGFIPSDDRGNGTKSWDRSHVPVGAIMLKEIYRHYPERWLLESTFDDLLTWNRWWMKARRNGELLSYGSHVAKNPLGEPDVHTQITAGYESGMDDSPMYEGVPFNPEKNMLELQDVGLNSLYVADCNALAEIAKKIDRNAEALELTERAQQISQAMEQLWNQESGAYLNRRTDTGILSRRISPTIFYPLLARFVSPERAKEIVDKHFSNSSEFGGEFVLPSVPRIDPEFPKQQYWKGAVWPPLDFLVYLGLRNYGFAHEQNELAVKSNTMFLGEWQRKGFICENYSAIVGTCDDPRLFSDHFHTWGTLMGLPALIEAGKLPAPELPLPR